MTTTFNEDTSWATLPGRLGRPELELRTDPRSDPRIVAALAPFGMDTAAAPPPIDGTAPLETRLEFCTTAEIGFEALFDALMTGLPEIGGLTRSTETLQGVDGDQIQLFITRPADASGPLPCVLHIHGGAMVIMRAANTAYVRFREELAATGVLVIGVEYRNGAGVFGNYPFPAGLNDCAVALNWVHAHRDELRITTITVAGESGGANLALATSLKAKQDRRLHMIDGVYAMVPYISGVYGWSEADRARALPSLVENDSYFMSCAIAEILASVYDPDGSHDRDPLCWPYHASPADLAGLPPHVITVNELDPLRDEGLAYYRKLLHARVERYWPHRAGRLPRRRPDVPKGDTRRVCRDRRRPPPLRRRPLTVLGINTRPQRGIHGLLVGRSPEGRSSPLIPGDAARLHR